MKRCFIFSAGTFYGLQERPTADDLVIAADAGYLNCKRECIVPDLLIGDFDSMDQPADFANIIRVPVEKDDPDTMLAVRTAIDRGCGEIHLYGATGGKRMDHTLANLQTLLWICHQGVRGYLYDDDFVYTAICNETLTIQKTLDWGLVSVFCLNEPAKGVTERGMQYSLTDATLRADQPLAVSNHFEGPEAVITVRDGTLIVGWELPHRA